MPKLSVRLAKKFLAASARGRGDSGGRPAGPKIYFSPFFAAIKNTYLKAVLTANETRLGRLIVHGRWLFLGRTGHLELRDGVHVNEGINLPANNTLREGDGVHLTAYCQMYTSRLEVELARRCEHSSKPIVVGRNVWLGANTVVLGGVTIGENAIVGAHSLVNRDLPPNVLAAGIPARVIRSL